ncbi:MAG: S9 family peptidase [Thermomicrobiales bacterium]
MDSGQTERRQAVAPFTPEKIREQAQIQDVALSPDGALVVYSRRVISGNRYCTHLWLTDWAGSPARQLTFATANDVEPAISPDGATVAFVSNRNGVGQVWTLPLGGGEARMLAGEVRGAEGVWWSPDGERLLVLASSGVERLSVGDPDDPTARVITDFWWRLDSVGFLNQVTSAWVVNVASGAATRVTDLEWDVLDARWLDDGAVAVVADAGPDAGMRGRTEGAAAWRIAADGAGTPALLAELPGGVAVVRPEPGGQGLAMLGYARPGQPNWSDRHLFLVEDGEVRRLGPELDRPIESVSTGDLLVRGSRTGCEWQADGSIVALVGDRGRTIPFRFDPETGSAAPLVGGDLIANALALAPGKLAVLGSLDGQPTEIFALEEGNLRPLTTNGSAWLAPHARKPRRVAIDHPEGHQIEAWLVERADGAGEPGPLVVQIHGGPHAAHGPAPWLEMLAMADAGYTVLYPNPRGSSGYGEDFAHAAHGGWGPVGSSDILRCVEWATEEGLADPARVGVMGLSHGGYLTAWLLGHHPGVFRAAVSENPVSNFVSWYGGSDLQAYTDDRFAGLGRLPEDVDAFLAASPFMQIHHNTAPLLLLQSEGDLRCPPEQAETLFTILRLRGVPVHMVRYPGEPHFLAGIGRPDRRVDRLERILGWFGEYL